MPEELGGPMEGITPDELRMLFRVYKRVSGFVSPHQGWGGREDIAHQIQSKFRQGIRTEHALIAAMQRHYASRCSIRLVYAQRQESALAKRSQSAG